MLFLSKVLAQLVYPLNLSVLLGLLSGALLWRGRRGLGAVLLVVSLALLWVFSVPVCSDRLRASLERRYLPVPLADLPRSGAIVVLGGLVEPAITPRLDSDLQASADRVLYAARLYRAGKAPLVIVTGGNLPWQNEGRAEAYLVAELLSEWQVPTTAIVAELKSRTTYENAHFTKALLKALGIDQVLLVTSALHMPRALATFRAAGIQAIPAPTDYEVVDRQMTTLLEWLPDAEALAGSTRALKEYLGLGVYWLRGWVK
jgi:uncharacterized SAM-binding protein YcdF (DUF218 family)